MLQLFPGVSRAFQELVKNFGVKQKPTLFVAVCYICNAIIECSRCTAAVQFMLSWIMSSLGDCHFCYACRHFFVLGSAIIIIILTTVFMVLSSLYSIARTDTIHQINVEQRSDVDLAYIFASTLCVLDWNKYQHGLHSTSDCSR